MAVDSRGSELMALITSDCEVKEMEIYVVLTGPTDSVYAGWQWKIKLLIPEGYPNVLPSIFFTNKIYHPQVDERTGLVSPNAFSNFYHREFGLPFVFNILLPVLMMESILDNYILNQEAADLFTTDQDAFVARAIEYCVDYATRQAAPVVQHQADPLVHDSNGSGSATPPPASEEDGNTSYELDASPQHSLPSRSTAENEHAQPAQSMANDVDEGTSNNSDAQPAQSMANDVDEGTINNSDAQPAQSMANDVDEGTSNNSDAQPAQSMANDVDEGTINNSDAQPAQSMANDVDERGSRRMPGCWLVDLHPAIHDRKCSSDKH